MKHTVTGPHSVAPPRGLLQFSPVVYIRELLLAVG